MSKALKIRLYSDSLQVDDIKKLTGWDIGDIIEQIQGLGMLEKPIHHIGLFNYRGCPWYDNLIKANGEYFTILDKSTGRMEPTWFNGNQVDYKRMPI